MNSERKVIVGATFVSVVVHVLAVSLTWNLPLIGEGELQTAPANADEIELILVPDEASPPEESSLPDAYTAVPERAATSEPPDDPDFLAMHHAQAADQLEGGEEDSDPGADREDEMPQMEVRRESLDGAGGVTFTTPALQDGQPAPAPQTAREAAGEQAEQSGDDVGELGDMALPNEAEQSGQAQNEGEPAETVEPQPEVPDWMGARAPSILKQGTEAAGGDRGFDFDQMSVGKVGANISFQGAFSLSTYEWNFAPWMHRFEQDLHRHWNAPYAYRLGIIHGKTQIRLVVERDGHPSAMEVIGTDGHESLHHASVSALKAFAPYVPLPPDFPEEYLVIILTLHYPAWRR
jgi:hypothetical protein